ncbi:MAG: PH domain-containing protein [Candidatus Shapirobacteria bacterium]|nr:PH domain-containing protein [Candidatus Shapirobacteria bacterium]
MPDIFVGPQKETKTTPLKKLAVPEREPVFKKPFGFLSAFIPHPINLRYEFQEKDEKIVLFLRHHFFTNFGWLIATFCLALVPIFAFSFFPFKFVPLSFRFIGFIAWYLLTFAFGFERFLSWFFNINIVTDRRIIDVNFPSILYKDISECKLDNIQDVSSKIGGFARSFLNYGDVLIQTAGALPELSFEAIPFPDKVAEIINDLIAEEEGEL